MHFLALTFYGESRLVVSSDGEGAADAEFPSLLAVVKKILGPFQDQAKSYAYSGTGAIVLEHRRLPFGSARRRSDKESVCVQLCVLFREFYKRGWTAAANSRFDPLKRRGNVLFRKTGPPVDCDFGAFCLDGSGENSHAPALIGVLPEPSEAEILQNLQYALEFCEPRGPTLSRQATEGRVFSVRSTQVSKLTARSVFVSDYPSYFSAENAHCSVRVPLKVLKTMASFGYSLEATVGVFGPLTHDVLFFAKSPNAAPPPSLDPLFALTVMNPKKVVLVEAPVDACRTVKDETEAWRDRGYEHSAQEFWGRKEAHSVGKASFVGLLTSLYRSRFEVVACYDGIYKNSFFIFTSRQHNRVDRLNRVREGFPKILAFSIVTDKKLKLDDVELGRSNPSVPSSAEVAGQNLLPKRSLAALDASAARPKRNAYNDRIRAFDSDSFTYYNAGVVAAQMHVFLSLAKALLPLGLEIYCCGNISGRYEYDNDSRGISPHSWFFMDKPVTVRRSWVDMDRVLMSDPTVTAPSYDAVWDAASVANGASSAYANNASSYANGTSSYAEGENDGLPTYEEAINMS